MFSAILVLPLHAQEKAGTGLSEQNEKQLERDKVLITQNQYKQIYGVYSGSGGEFITSDTVIAAWNALLGKSLEMIDMHCAAALPGELDDALKVLPSEPPAGMSRADFDAASRKAKLILGVASRLMDGSWKGGPELDGLISEEVKRIESAQGTSLPTWLTLGEANPVRSFDYAIFKPTAAYVEYERMAQYYRAVRWLQYASMAPQQPVNQAAHGMIIEAVRRKDTFAVLSEITEMLFGPTEGEEKEFKRLSAIEPGNGLDVRLFDQSTTIKRPWPDPVEAMALAGMPMAVKMLSSEPTVSKGIENLSASQAWAQRPLHLSYLKAMGALSDTESEDLPAFMKSEAWQRKCLNTGLAGWAQISHATALTRGNAGIGFGGYERPPRSFVEPNPEFFHRFSLMISETIQGLESVYARLHEGYEMTLMTSSWLELKDLCSDLENLAHKQLRGLELSERDQMVFNGFGKRLESCMIQTRETKDDAPQVAVGYSRPGVGVLLVGTGRPQEILVKYPWKGEEYVCSGAVLPFRSLQTNRVLSDKEWKELLDSPQAPPPPEWLQPILAK
ncbi:MAG: DUF3160 domain-containing protein [Luteolibacter sp.]